MSSQASPSQSPQTKQDALYLNVFSELLGENGVNLWNIGQSVPHTSSRHTWYEAWLHYFSTGDIRKVNEQQLYRNIPCEGGIVEFIESPDYMDAKNVVWPKIMEELVELNDSGKYVEAVLTGSIGCGKTSVALWTTAYQLYMLSCYLNPHALFGLDPSHEIMFIFQSLNATLAKTVDYMRFKTMIEKSPYFSTYFPFVKGIESELRFQNRIVVKPVTGSSAAALGQNVMGGVIDEMNFMAVIENSKISHDGGTYNQAIQVYNALSRRRKSRFMEKGKLPGILCLVSSKLYPGEFTDQKIEDARTDPTLFVYDKTSWDVQDSSRFSGKWFWVYCGTLVTRPRVLSTDEYDRLSEDDKSVCVSVPEEYRTEFEKDILNALRDIAGRSTMALHPFIMNRELVASCFGKTKNVISKDCATLTKDDGIEAFKSRIKNPKAPRFGHIDLGLSADSAGIAIGHIEKFVKIKRGNTVETMPKIVFDVLLEVPPPPGGEILFYRIREIFYALRDLDLPIRWVTLDTYQSVDTRQLLAQKGFLTGNQSMDTSMLAYDFLKGAFYDGRIEAPMCKKALKELFSLEKDEKKKKIDHPPLGSKDLADAMAGVVFGLTNRRENWFLHGVSPTEIPQSVLNALKEDKEKEPTSKEVKEERFQFMEQRQGGV